VDSEVDARLDKLGTPEAAALRGQAAIANARLAYERYERVFSSPRWHSLAADGARPQRPLWASTSTKNPDYPDTLYVDELIGPDTVNTMPDATIDAARDHATPARTVDRDVDGARALLDELEEIGVPFEEIVTRELVDEGVASFSESYESLLKTLESKAEELSAAAR
jgi:transaldolase